MRLATFSAAPAFIERRRRSIPARASTLLSVLLMTLALLPGAHAAPPPGPPAYVNGARKALTAPSGIDAAALAPLFSDDVAVFENGKTIATGKSEWLKLLIVVLQNKSRRVVLYNEGAGDLLIIDTYDAVDRTGLAPTFIADPRMEARSTLYQFGPDHLIHAVRISSATGFWAAPRN